MGTNDCRVAPPANECDLSFSAGPATVSAEGILTWHHRACWSADGRMVAAHETDVSCPFESIGVIDLLPYKPNIVFVGGVRCRLTGGLLAVEGKLLKVSGRGVQEAPEMVYLSDEQTKRLIAGDKNAADEAINEWYRDRPIREEIVAAEAPRYAEVLLMAVHLGDGWHVVPNWQGPDREYRTHCGRRFFCHGPRSCNPIKTSEARIDLWPEAEPGGRVCGCYWYFRRDEVEP